MKHLKFFENYQEDMYNKHIMNILGDFSYRLEQILISISRLSSTKHTIIKRNIFDSNNIDITYFAHNRVKLLKTNLDIKENLFYIKIKSYYQNYITDIKTLRKGCDDFLDFINDKLQKYSIVNK